MGVPLVNIMRILCWLGRHDYRPMNYHSRYRDGVLVYRDLTCNCSRCGKQSEKRVLYRKPS